MLTKVLPAPSMGKEEKGQYICNRENGNYLGNIKNIQTLVRKGLLVDKYGHQPSRFAQDREISYKSSTFHAKIGQSQKN